MTAKELDSGSTSGDLSAARVPAVRKALPLLPGLVAVILLGLASYYLARQLSTSFKVSLDAIVIALILGLVVKNLLPQRDSTRETVPSLEAVEQPEAGSTTNSSPAASPVAQGFSLSQFISGAQLGNKILIPAAIILYGANLDLSRLATLPWQVILITLLGMGLFYILIYWLNPLIWKMPTRLNELIATGSAICGASAIVVVSPSIDAEPEETSTSLLVITGVGLLAMMVYPILRSMLNLSDEMYALLSGATLHQTGLVRAAMAQAIPALSESASSYGLAVKTLRIVMLAPVAIVSGLLHLRSRRRDHLVEASASGQRQGSYWIRSLLRVWFLIPFIILGLLTSFIPAVREFMANFKTLETIVFSSALASVGFDIDIDSVLQAGVRPVLVAVFGWLVVMLFFLFVAPLFIA